MGIEFLRELFFWVFFFELIWHKKNDTHEITLNESKKKHDVKENRKKTRERGKGKETETGRKRERKRADEKKPKTNEIQKYKIRKERRKQKKKCHGKERLNRWTYLKQWASYSQIDICLIWFSSSEHIANMKGTHINVILDKIIFSGDIFFLLFSRTN